MTRPTPDDFTHRAFIAAGAAVSLLGGLGLALATPMLAATVVLVDMLYVEDILHEDPRP